MPKMNVQTTDRVLTCYRIGDTDGAFSIFDSDGACRHPGRWNTRTSPISCSWFVLVVACAYLHGIAAELPNRVVLEVKARATIELTHASVPAAKVTDTTQCIIDTMVSPLCRLTSTTSKSRSRTVSATKYSTAAHPRWGSDKTIHKTFGRDWFDGRRSAFLAPDAKESPTPCPSRWGGMNVFTRAR